MKTFLSTLLLLVTGVGQATVQVQVQPQSDGLLVSATQLHQGEKYSECWLASQDQEYEVDRLSPNSWLASTYPSSGTITLVVCSEAGTCRLYEEQFDLHPNSWHPWWLVIAFITGGAYVARRLWLRRAV